MKKPRPIEVRGDVAFIPLNKGYFAVIDASDLHLVSGVCWSAAEAFDKSGEVRSVYATQKSMGVARKLHRVILDAPAGFEVDHIDGDGLNNRRSNLRIATRIQNQRNARRRIDNSSGVKGVSWNARVGKWQVRIQLNQNRLHLGYFDILQDAAACYVEAAKKHHGEFFNPRAFTQPKEIQK